MPCGTAKDTKANITGLSEGKPYKFRVKAVNKEGESEELETDKPIIAKNPFGECKITLNIVPKRLLETGVVRKKCCP